MSTSHGQKVTTDPEAQTNPKNENPGVVTSDSLAGESLNQGGDFGTNSGALAPNAQKSAGTTTNNTDTSGATTLDPARDSNARQTDELSGSGGQQNVSSQHQSERQANTFAVTPGTSGSSEGGSGAAASGGASGRNVGGAGAVAAGGVGDTTNQPTGSGAGIPSSIAGGPKGANLTEDPNLGEASGSAEIGSENDPGRLALGRTDVPVSGGAGAAQGEVTNDGQFDALKDTSA